MQNWHFYLELSVEYSVLIRRVITVAKELFSEARLSLGDAGGGGVSGEVEGSSAAGLRANVYESDAMEGSRRGRDLNPGGHLAPGERWRR